MKIDLKVRIWNVQLVEKIMRSTEGKDGIKYYKWMYCGKLIKD